MKKNLPSDPRRKGVRCGGNRRLIHDRARLDCLLENSTRAFLNLLFDVDDRTIAHSWVTLRRPDAHGTDVIDLRQELRDHYPLGIWTDYETVCDNDRTVRMNGRRQNEI